MKRYLKTKNSQPLNKMKKKDISKYFVDTVIIDDNSSSKKKLTELIFHITSEQLFVDMCINKIKQCGGKIRYIQLAVFVQNNCNYLKI